LQPIKSPRSFETNSVRKFAAGFPFVAHQPITRPPPELRGQPRVSFDSRLKWQVSSRLVRSGAPFPANRNRRCRAAFHSIRNPSPGRSWAGPLCPLRVRSRHATVRFVPTADFTAPAGFVRLVPTADLTRNGQSPLEKLRMITGYRCPG
jgi:hypothetical protein